MHYFWGKKITETAPRPNHLDSPSVVDLAGLQEFCCPPEQRELLKEAFFPRQQLHPLYLAGGNEKTSVPPRGSDCEPVQTSWLTGQGAFHKGYYEEEEEGLLAW